MSAMGSVVRSGVGRRRVQTVVITLVVMIAVTSAVLGGALLVASSEPFDRAFAEQHGAHLTTQIAGDLVTSAQLEATAQVSGVTAAAGPFPTAVINPVRNNRGTLPAMTVAGRADAGGAVDAVSLLEGRWVTGPGEIVLRDDGRYPPDMLAVGVVLTMPEVPGAPPLTVVGLATSSSRTADGWVVPEQVAALRVPEAAAGYQMLYRFSQAADATQMDARRAAIEAALPAGAVTGSQSWLAVKLDSAGQTVLYVPILIAFGLLGVLMAVLIVGNVVAGAVSTGTYRIGILKALGFTPAQVVRAYLGQALVPAAVGGVLGVVAGNLIAVPVLADADRLYGTSGTGVPIWLDVAVFAGALGVVAVTTLAAASKAGRLRTVDALAVGRTPRPGRGGWATRLTARLPLPRPVSLGLAHPFARPVRTLSMVAAIAFGAAAVTFAVGLGASLAKVQATETHGDVLVRPAPQRTRPPGGDPGGPRTGGPEPIDAAAAVAAITAQSGTAGWSGVAETEVTVAGLTGSQRALALAGDGSAASYEMIDGRWLTGPGEIVVAKPFLTATRTKIGDTVVLTDHGKEISVRIVGEAFNIQDRGMQILTAIETLQAAEPELAAFEYHITLEPGTDQVAYLAGLNVALEPVGAQAEQAEDETAEFILLVNALAALLTLLLGTVAALGVLNTVVLETRERVHDLGVHKALGMTPRQTVAMVIASVVVTGVIGGAIGALTGVLLQRLVVGDMGRVSGLTLPASVLDVYGPTQLVLFGLGGLLIAVLGALLPAGWAAGTRTATALRTE